MNTNERCERAEGFGFAVEEMGEEGYVPQPYRAEVEAPEALDEYPF